MAEGLRGSRDQRTAGADEGTAKTTEANRDETGKKRTKENNEKTKCGGEERKGNRMRQTKTRAFSWLLMLVMVFSLISPSAVQQVNAEETKAYDGYVYVTVEKTTLGQGFAQEPIKVGYYEDEMLEQVLARGLGENLIVTNGSYGKYISGYQDGGEPEGWNEEYIPKDVKDLLTKDQLTVAKREENDITLDETEYTQRSSFSYSVDNKYAQVGISSLGYKANEENGSSFHDGSVIRIQFSLDWGSDASVTWDGNTLIDFPNKDDLIKDVAELKAYSNTETHKNAMSVLEKWDATAQEVEDAEKSLDTYKKAKNYSNVLTKALANRKPDIGEAVYGQEWLVLGMARNGITDDAWYHSYYQSVEQTLANSKDNMIDSYISANSRTAIAVTAMGLDATNIGGKNLLEPLANFDNLKTQYVTIPAYALIAFDCGKYDIPKTATGEQTTKEKLINTITSAFLDTGVIGGDGYVDIDSTAMALQAIAPYYTSNETVKNTVDKSLEYLSENQNKDGTFGDYDVVCTTAQVICALSALGIDANTNDKFIKNGNTMVDAMVAYAKEDGSIAVPKTKNTAMSTEQAAYALTAYDRFKKNMNGLYEIADDNVTADTFYKCADSKKTTANKKTATCTEDGYTGDIVCDKCGLVYEEGKAIPKKGHTVVIDPAVEPTEDKEGKTEGSHCSVCNTVLKAQTVIPKKEKKSEQPASTEQATTAQATTQQPTTQATTEAAKVVLKKPAIAKAKSSKKGQLKLTWKAVLNISGYQIQVSTSSKFKKAKTYNVKKSMLNKTLKGLVSGKKYYVRTRTYTKVTVDGKQQTRYSKWSKVKKVKVK